MYTSGSTGNPKGVLVPHRAVLRLVKNNSFASFSAGEVFLQLAPLSFDAATFEIWGALLNGGRLVLAPAGRVTPEDIGALIQQYNVTTLWLTAALFHLIATTHIETLRPLHQLLAGGDVLSVTHVRRVVEELPHLRLINGYGPTENTTFTCCHTISLDSLASGMVPIGRAHRQHSHLHRRRRHAAGARRRHRRALRGRRRRFARLLNAPELTAEKVHSATPSRQDSLNASTAPATWPAIDRRHRRIPRSRRHPGQGSRLPHRACRNRIRARAFAAGPRSRRLCAH